MSDIKDSIIEQTSQAIDGQQENNELQQILDQEKLNKEEDLKKLKAKAGAVHFLLDVMNMSENADTSFYPTGFKKLDEVLDGGLYPGLYIMGAISSLGKTTFMLQIADQIAASGTDVLYFSLEMSGPELVSKSISRLTYQLCDGAAYMAKSARGITTPSLFSKYDDREKALIDKANHEYTKAAKNIYIFEGMGDIGVNKIAEEVMNHRRLTGKKAVVMIDYLQILAPYDPRCSDKQNTDKAVLELKRMSRDFNMPVVAISSFNRDSYSSEVSYSSFKESGAIEYGSDILIALQPQGMLRGNTKTIQNKNIETTRACKMALLRKIELVILKNRNGSTEGRVGFSYRPVFNLFDEDPDYKPNLNDPEDDIPEVFEQELEDKAPFKEANIGQDDSMQTSNGGLDSIYQNFIKGLGADKKSDVVDTIDYENSVDTL